MTVSRDLCLVLGAVLGIAAVYIAPSTSSAPSDEKSRPKKYKDKQNPKLVVRDPDNNIVHAEVHPTINQIKYGELTVLEMFNILKTEVLNILDSTGVRLFIPDAESSNTSSDYEDAKSEFATKSPDTAAPGTSDEPVHPVPDTQHTILTVGSTIYNTLPNESISAPSTQKKGVTKKIRKIYSGLTSKGESHNPRAQSTTVDDKSGFIVSFKNPKSPVRRAFRRLMDSLGFKNNSSQNTDVTPKPTPWCVIHDRDYYNNDITLHI